MRVVSYTFHDIGENGWRFENTTFGQFNLLVGATASGKTKFLNTLFNLGVFAVREGQFRNGFWDLQVDIFDQKYRWVIETEKPGTNTVKSETLSRITPTGDEIIVQRSTDSFTFNGTAMPRLSPSQTSIYLLREEEAIRPLYEGFSRILRRRFFADEAGNQDAPQVVNRHAVEQYQEAPDKRAALFPLQVAARLYLLQESHDDAFSRDTLDQIKQWYRATFPFVTDVAVLDRAKIEPEIPVEGFIPVFCVREKNVEGWINYSELSSGMQKVLIILTDMLTMPDGGIYLIDEYENSLGVNAIGFLPGILGQLDNRIQLFVTSHHPYLINQVSPKDWYVFNRRGSVVRIRSGEENARLFGQSSQEAFVQLVSDPFYTGEGI